MSVEGKQRLLPVTEAKRPHICCLHLSRYKILSCQVLSLDNLVSDYLSVYLSIHLSVYLFAEKKFDIILIAVFWPLLCIF